jgi:hypothetical protein
MNTLQNVYDRLSDKTELAKHEVALALVDDLISLISKGDSNIKNAFDLRSKGKDLIRQSISNEKLAIEVYSQGLQLGKTILTKMKELGIQDPIVNEKIKYFEMKISGSKDRLKVIEKAITSFN